MTFVALKRFVEIPAVLAMTTRFHASRTVVTHQLLRGTLAVLCWGGVTVSTMPVAVAQTSGALPLYRCIAADGNSSRMSRTPCAIGESGTAKQAVAGTSKPPAAIVYQTTPNTPVTSQAQAERERVRLPSGGGSPRRRR